MRRSSLSLILCLCLSGCAYYGDLNHQAKPLSAHDLKQTQHFNANVTAQNRWGRFNDPLLNTLIASALNDSPTLQNAAARVRRAEALAAASMTTLWPSLDFSSYVQRQRFATYGLVPPPFNGKTYNIGDLALNLNYELDFWGKNRETIAAAVSNACAAQGEAAEARLILAAAVANAYFELQGAEAAKKLAETNARYSKEIAALVTHRAKNGIDSDIPLKSALVDQQNATLAVSQYQQRAELAEHQLAILVGKNPFSTHIQAAPFKGQGIALPAHLPANLLAKRPDVFAALERMEAAAHTVNVAKARFFPNINLNILYSYQAAGLNRLFLADSKNYAYTGAVDLPIFDAGLRRANLKADYAEFDMAITAYNQTLLTALQDVADQSSTLRNLDAELRSQTAAINATRSNFHLFKARYQHGIVSYFQVLEIQQALIQQEATLLDLQVARAKATVALLKALGGEA